jgi:predicted nucleic acid-binding protein
VGRAPENATLGNSAFQQFLDANVLVYSQDAGARRKRRKRRELVAQLAKTGNGVISTQVMQAFFVAATRKLGIPSLAAKGVL